MIFSEKILFFFRLHMMASDDEWANEEWNEDTLTLVPDIKSMCINDKAKKHDKTCSLADGGAVRG